MRRSHWLTRYALASAMLLNAPRLLSISLAEVSPDAAIDQVRALQAVSKHAEAIAAAEAARQSLPASARLRTWSIPFGNADVTEVILGKRYGYFRMSQSTRGANAPADSRPVIGDGVDRYDEQQVVTCVDLQTGVKLWSRRFEGPFLYNADPQTDDLWAFCAVLVRLSGKTGDVELRETIHGKWREISGLRVHDQDMMHVQRTSGGTYSGGPITLYDVQTHETVQSPFQMAQRLSANKLRMLSTSTSQSPDDVTTTASLVPVAGGKSQWQFATPGYSANAPIWLGGDALVYSGAHGSAGVVTRINGATGEVKWQFHMPCGAYDMQQVYSNSNGHYEKNWDAIGLMADHVLAIGDDGRMVLLDAATGQLRATLSEVRFPLCFPQVVGDTLVVAAKEGLFAVHLDVVLNRRRTTEAQLVLAEVRSTMASGRAQDALKLTSLLVEEAPDLPESWEAHADVADKLGMPGVAAAARCRVLQMRGETVSPELQKRYGLLARIPSGPIRANLVPLGSMVYAGTQAGELLRIDKKSLQPIDFQQYPIDISSLSLSGSTLYRWGTDRHKVQVATVLGATSVDPEGLVDEEKTRSAPREWHTTVGYDGRVVEYKDRYYRPLHGGGVRVTDLKTVTEYRSPLPDIQRWNIYLGPGGPLGYGTGGVYLLDENLCPTKRLISAGVEQLSHRPNAVELLACDGKTLAVVVGYPPPAVIQIWSLDGTTKLREETMLFGGSGGYASSGRLFAYQDGYFFAGGELLWLTSDPARPAWRFQLGKPEEHHWITRIPNTRFGSPCVIDNRLFVSEASGGIFVFDLRQVIQASK